MTGWGNPKRKPENLAGVPGYHQQVYMGLIIVVAMLLQYGTGSLKR